MTLGQERLSSAEWLLGFDFDGTLANSRDGDSVAASFFHTLEELQATSPTAWGICTGRSLEYLLEGMQRAQFPILPDYIVTQERDLFYLGSDQSYHPDLLRNQQAFDDLHQLMRHNSTTLSKVQGYIEQETDGEWVSVPDDPAGIIATEESHISHAVSLYENCPAKTADLEYQRNTIYLRFSHRGYCKGTAVQYLQETYQIAKESTLVMGDNYNDMTMLKPSIAKHFGAPSNVIPQLRSKLANLGGFVTSQAYSLGVTEAIQEQILKSVR